jgi:cellulose synthase/poly-beta-1,6-N-acetylglucosamine synthase-like glycosyltransferase
MELWLWSPLAAVFWTYAGYPLLLLVLARRRRPEGPPGALERSVSVIIAAHNEEASIAEKLESTLRLDHPGPPIEIIVASDCSTDRTHEIVRGFQDRGVKLIVMPERRGKTAAQNAAARQARGEILVFTDATTRLPADAVRNLVQGFADPRVGCVGAALDYVSEGGTAVGKGGSLYWRYERAVKNLESRANSLIGVSGCLYAVAASVYAPIEPDLISDFTIALRTYEKGYITTYAAGTVSQEKTHESARREFEMRTRIIIRTIHALVRNARMLDPFRHGLFALQLWSHKVLRYLVPEFLLAVLCLSAVLAVRPGPRTLLYQVLLGLQLFAYLAVPALYWAPVRAGIRIRGLQAPLYFTQANAAAFWALVSYLRGERKVTWTTVR